MKIYLVGDAASGKTTFLENFSDPHFAIFPEEGHQQIPPLLEESKFYGYLWFYLYYYYRDRSIATDKIPIIERGLSEDYALLEACYQTNKINSQERDIMRYIIDRMMADLSITHNDLVIHFICRNEIIRQRLEARGRRQGEEKDLYWNVYRNELKTFYSGKCQYYSIDTSNLPIEGMVHRVGARIRDHVSAV